MIRPAIVLALLLSSAVMMRGVAGDWRKGPPTPAEISAKKATPAGEAASLPPQAKSLQPVVPGVLPDLKDGYLFNPERMLAGAEPPPAAEDKVDEAASENTPGIAAKIADVTYAGSIIADNFKRAIIVYKEAEKGKAPAAQPASRSSKVKPPPPAAAAAGGEKHAQLEVGDVLDGYTVAEIHPDKLVFSKDDDTIEKLLYDPGKKRQAPPPRAAAVPPGGGGQPRPGGVQATTIGGAAPPAPPAPGAVTPPPALGAVNSPTPPAPAAANPPIPPAPVATPTVKSPTTPSATASPSATPVRRMVISRQPSPAGRPDTSRVIRQSQTDGEDVAPPMPPGAGDTANEATTTLPLPEGH